MITVKSADPKMAAAVANGIITAANTREMRIMKKRLDRLELKDAREIRYWRNKIRRANRKYGKNPKPKIIERLYLMGMGMVILGLNRVIGR